MISVTTCSILIVVLSGLSLVSQIYGLFLTIRARDLAPLHQGIMAAQKTLSDLESRIKELQGELANADKTIAEGKYWDDWLKQHRDDCIKLQADITKTQKDLDDQTDQYSRKNQEYVKLQGDLQTAGGQLAKAQNDALTAENAKKTAEADKQAAEAKLKNTQESQNRADVALKNTQDNLHELERQKRDAEEDLRRIQERKNEEEKKSEAAKKQFEELNAKIHGQQSALEGQDTQIAIREGQLKTLVNSDANKWADLDDRPIIKNQPKERQRLNEAEWLIYFKKNLELCDIRFHERSINAFHTALKVADQSPLTVLAGISGTGKSLLPQLYARAIGMNFLQIAVQPRWDGPQDMFGFYNYMENRYKATELSRLLWQFDCFNNAKAKEVFGSQDNLPMNLILLDEMNLARVEYYFSDMLSKLEVRRNIDPSDDTQRKSAEIEIECPPNRTDGNGTGKQDARRLFVGQNSLFIGTMNEDETTQALSDKVVDRSNVLRFGQPAKLDAKPKTQDFYAQYEPRTLSYATWKKDWIRTGEDANTKQAAAIMSRLNDVLGKIGRPFAYRSWLAVQAYVRNYPDQTHWQWAIADQIEMKILPKLNGVEMSATGIKNALDSIHNEIGALGDNDLTDAFNKCRNDGNIFFQWRGVSRK